uniref:Uncharacterized protein n=1 Tax=Micrurus paraensis TaxID=1970185 RepID=A0A2D4KKY0_9SAUR
MEASKEFKLELQTVKEMLKERRGLLDTLAEKVMQFIAEQRNPIEEEPKEEENSPDGHEDLETLPKDTKGIKTKTLMTEIINKRENVPKSKQKKNKLCKKKFQKREKERVGGKMGTGRWK